MTRPPPRSPPFPSTPLFRPPPIMVSCPRPTRRIPSPFVALIVTPAAVQLLHLPVDTIGSRFGVINAALPAPSHPAVTFHQMRSEERRVGKEGRSRWSPYH